MTKTILSAALAMAFAFACGGGSGGGPGGNKRLAELTPAEVQSTCENFVDILGPARTITCPEGTRTVGDEDAAECVAELGNVNAECAITVGQYQDCIEAIADLTDAEICDDALPAECGILLSDQTCFGGDGPAPPPES